MSPTNTCLHGALLHQSARHSSKTAIYWGDTEVSYLALSYSIRNIAVKLQLAGVKSGDHVGLWMKNCPEFIIAYFAILSCGAVVVPVNNFLKPAEIRFILEDAEANVVVSENALIAQAGDLTSSNAQPKLLAIEDLLNGAADAGFNPVPRTRDDLAVIIYTSGTTGRPKGAMLSHGNLLHNVASCEVVLAAVDADRFAVMLPLFHSFMMTVGMILPLMVGGSIVLIKSLNPPKNAIIEIIRRGATILPAVPQFFRALAGAGVKDQLPLRLCISGGAPLPGEILREFEDSMPIPLIEGYGLSESSPVASLNPINGRRKPGSIGVPISNVELAVWNDEGVALGVRETGEIVIRGGNVMMGYWKNPEASAQALRDGWLLTGDIGYRDEDGYFFITDRKKDMLLVNGINVYPREIEEVIYQFPGVREAAVIGKTDPRRGEQAIAFVSANEGAVIDGKELSAFLKSKLADYKVPRKIIQLPALPRTATGKILKTSLRELTV